MEPIYFGATNLSKLYAGGTEIVQVYFNGSTMLSTGNPANMPFIGNTVNYGTSAGQDFLAITTNDAFIYAGGDGNRQLQKFHEGNLVKVTQSVSLGPNTQSDILSIVSNNGKIFVGTELNRVRSFHESNLVLAVNSPAISNLRGVSLAVNNGFVYVPRRNFRNVLQLFESNLVSTGGATANYTGEVQAVAINNGFLYVGGFRSTTGVNRGVSKYHESNLVLVGNTVNYAESSVAGNIFSIAINNGFLYVGGDEANIVQKFNESTLALVGQTSSFGQPLNSVSISNGFIYVGGRSQRIGKYYEGNLAFVANIAEANIYLGDPITQIHNNDGFFYVVGKERIFKYAEQGT
jgi:hypothetical protein